jgi:hypothetical protein
MGRTFSPKLIFHFILKIGDGETPKKGKKIQI